MVRLMREHAVIQDEIMTAMLDGRWSGAGMRRALADKYSISRSTAWDLEQGAYAALRHLSQPDLPMRLAASLARVEHLYELALSAVVLTKDGDEVRQPDLKAALAALRLEGELLGMLGPKLAALKQPTGAGQDDVDRMSPTEQIATFERAIQELKGRMQ